VSECGYVRSRLDDYIDGSLPPLEYRKIKAHLISCPKCNREAEELFFITENMENLLIEPADLLNIRIKKEIAKDSKWRKKRLRKYYSLAAAVMLTLTVTCFIPKNVPTERVGDDVAIHSRGKNIIVDGESLPGNLTVVGGDVYVQGEIKGNVTSIDGQVSAMIDKKSIWQRLGDFFQVIWSLVTGGEKW